MNRQRFILNLFLAVIITIFSGLQVLWAAEPTFDEAKDFLLKAAEKKRLASANMTFDEFKATVYREPFKGGKYIVNGDTPITNEKQLREFFEKNVKSEPPARKGKIDELIVHLVGGLDAVWSDSDKRRLTYCVSNDFSHRHTRVVAAMESATDAWEAVADIDFIYIGTEDSRCNAWNPAVMFDVRPVDVAGRYLARAFFPNEPRSSRNVLIDTSSFELNPNGKLTLTGILRHELGHTLGFRHEHTRPDSGACHEDESWRPITDYDPFSVMHYPQCNGLGDWSLTLTAADMSGAACLYGPAVGFTVDPDICGSDSTRTKTKTYKDQVVEKGKEIFYPLNEPPFRVKPGTPFKAEMRGSGVNSGDPDLYLKFDGNPHVADYDCRPYLVGPDEICSVKVPEGKQAAGIMVRGYTSGSYTLSVTYTEPK